MWEAGPLAKGYGLCHGTAGNGYAFLALHRRTGDARWLERARAFAMHAIGQQAAMRRSTVAAATRCGPAIPASRCTCGTACKARADCPDWTCSEADKRAIACT